MADRRLEPLQLDDLGRYRRLYVALWRDEDFCRLSAAAKVTCLYVLTGPQSNRIGIFQFSELMAAEDLLGRASDTLSAEQQKAFKTSLVEVVDSFGWRFDPKARVLWIPSWWKWNHTSSDKTMKGNLTDLRDVTETPLILEFARHTQYLPELADAFAALFPAGYLKGIEARAGRVSRAHAAGYAISGTVTGAGSVTGSGTALTPDHSADAGGPPPVDPAEPPPTEKEGVEAALQYQANLFVDWFTAEYPKRRNGAKFKAKRGDVEKIRGLLATWSPARLRQLAELLLLLDAEADGWVATTDRGIGVLDHRATWLDERLSAAEARR